MKQIVANCADVLTTNGSDAARCTTCRHICLWVFPLNRYQIYNVFTVARFVIRYNSNETTNNQYEIPCTVYFICLALHRCLRGTIDCGKASTEGQ